MIVSDEVISAEWAGVVVTAVGGLIALALLIFEMRTVRVERRHREAAESRIARDVALERARRVVSWIEPVMWQVEREGTVLQVAGGWKVVVSNDTDDTISNWRVAVARLDPANTDEWLLEAAGVEHGVIPPRSRFEADVRTAEQPTEPPPKHEDLSATTLLWWVDREAEFWQWRGAAGPIRVPEEGGRWSVQHPEISARAGGQRELQRHGYSVVRLN
ncbi:MAG: hypothetical protein K8R99_13475 [Actinomycetia bacterium]|nr:hypothetical protein [Actinomycetes bacterium]